MSGPETKCPKCGEELSGDFKCHNPKCPASDEFWTRTPRFWDVAVGSDRTRLVDLRDTQKQDSVP